MVTQEKMIKSEHTQSIENDFLFLNLGPPHNFFNNNIRNPLFPSPGFLGLMDSFEPTDHIFKTYLILRLSIYHTDSKYPSVLDHILCSVPTSALPWSASLHRERKIRRPSLRKHHKLSKFS